MSDEIERLCERLENRDTTRRGYYGLPLVNPDGPEAAAALRALQAENEQTLAMLRAEWDVIDSAWKARAEAAEAALVRARAAAFEEAAETVESLWAFRTCQEVADAIRALAAHGEKG